MAGGGSRGIPAARPTPHHLRSACTQVAVCGVWACVHEDQKPKQEREACAFSVAVRLAGGGVLEIATVGKPCCYS